KDGISAPAKCTSHIVKIIITGTWIPISCQAYDGILGTTNAQLLSYGTGPTKKIPGRFLIQYSYRCGISSFRMSPDTPVFKWHIEHVKKVRCGIADTHSLWNRLMTTWYGK